MHDQQSKKDHTEHGLVEYWGLARICQRMGWKHRLTPVRHAINEGFPLYVKARPGSRRQLYYSNERLIKSWEWARCEREIERLIKGAAILTSGDLASVLERTRPEPS